MIPSVLCFPFFYVTVLCNVIPEMIRAQLIGCIQLHYYHWVNTSADGLLVFVQAPCALN